MLAKLNGMYPKYEVSGWGGGVLGDVCVAQQPPPLREYGLVCSLYRQSLIALEDIVGEMSKKSFIGRN